MKNIQYQSLLLLSTLFINLSVSAVELDPHILAQREEIIGGMGNNRAIFVRISDNGRIEKLEKEPWYNGQGGIQKLGKETWVEVGFLAKPTLDNLKRETDVMMAGMPLVKKSQETFADGPQITYSVRNKEGMVAVIGTQDSIILQGGARSLVMILDGFKQLLGSSY